jgi:carboxypeptidase C (cathepsin A)
MKEAGKEFVTFIENFYEMYPEFLKHDLYLTGESFAGKYLPLYSNLLMDIEHNKYNLKAMLMGDPFTAPVTQRTHMPVLPFALDIVDDSNKD